MGAEIMGAGTDVIKIRGVERLSGGSYSIIPDQIEAGTYRTAVAAAGGDVYKRQGVRGEKTKKAPRISSQNSWELHRS